MKKSSFLFFYEYNINFEAQIRMHTMYPEGKLHYLRQFDTGSRPPRK